MVCFKHVKKTSCRSHTHVPAAQTPLVPTVWTPGSSLRERTARQLGPRRLRPLPPTPAQAPRPRTARVCLQTAPSRTVSPGLPGPVLTAQGHTRPGLSAGTLWPRPPCRPRAGFDHVSKAADSLTLPWSELSPAPHAPRVLCLSSGTGGAQAGAFLLDPNVPVIWFFSFQMVSCTGWS